MDDIRTTQLDGVRTVWAPCDGPLHARLVFRVGTADETLPTSGRTHLVEHLALFGIEDPASHHNGTVDQTTTVFHTHGDPSDVTRFLSQVTHALHDLPHDRLEQEKSVLAVEARGRARWWGDPLLLWRFGAVRHGLAALPSYGVRSATPEDLRAWTAERFTAGNAVLLLSGPPPSGLRLHLPAGPAWPAPDVVRQLDRLPAWFLDDLPGVAASAVLNRSNEVSVLTALAEQLMRDRLRTQQALSYSPRAHRLRLDATTTQVLLFADGAEGAGGAGGGLAALTRAFGQLVGELSVPQPQSVTAVVEAMLQEYRQARSLPDVATMMDLTSVADDLLHGRPHQSWQQIAAELEATDPERVAQAGRAFQRDALFALPLVDVDTAPFGRSAPSSTVETPAGQDYLHRDTPLVEYRTVVGPYGVASWEGPRLLGAVRFDRLAAATRWADGGLTLIGQDATHLRIEPTLWRDGAALVQRVLTRVDPALVVDLGERAADQVPRPGSTRARRLAARAKRATTSGTRLALRTALVAAFPLLYVIASFLTHRVLPLPALVIGIAIAIWLADPRGEHRS